MFFELLKLLLITAIPLWLLSTKRHSVLLFWIGINLGIEIFNVHLVVNVTPLNIVGLIYLPVAIRQIPRILTTKLGKLIILSFLLLAFLGLFYGHLFPWPDTSGVRPINQRAEGRSIIYLVHVLADLSVVVYIAYRAQKAENIYKLLRYILVGTTLASVGVMFQWISQIDIYSILVPGAPAWDFVAIGGRLRGFNGEPRTSGQIIAWGIILLIGLSGLGRSRFILLIIHLAGFAFTMSTTALIILMAGLSLWGIITFIKKPARVIFFGVILGLLLSSALFFNASLVDIWKPYLEKRISRIVNVESTNDLGESIANRLEVFDASAMLFLWDNPEYMLFGTGPGLVSLPASNYVLTSARSIYGDRIDSIPHMGLVLLLANTGIVGILLWLGIFFVGYRGLLKQSLIQKDKRLAWQEALNFYIIFSGLYLLQAKPVWYIFLGISLGATLQLRYHQQMQQTKIL